MSTILAPEGVYIDGVLVAPTGGEPMSDDLARRLAAHPRWEWMPGMLTLPQGSEGDDWWEHPVRLLRARIVGWDVVVMADTGAYWRPNWPAHNGMPDLADAATCGCLEQMLLDAINAASHPDNPFTLSVSFVRPHWDDPQHELGDHYEVSLRVGVLVQVIAAAKLKGEALAEALLVFWAAADGGEG